MPAGILVPAIRAVIVNVHHPATLYVASELTAFGSAIIRAAIPISVVPVVLVVAVALVVLIVLIIPIALTVTIVSA